MTNVVNWLRTVGHGSGGLSDEAAAFVLDHPEMLNDLLTGLEDDIPVVRARTADALEKIGRQRPDLLRPLLREFATVTSRDEKPAVKMHLAMIFGHLTIYSECWDELYRLLLNLLSEPGVFARSWTIASLCILACQEPAYQPEILNRISLLSTDVSIAIRTRVRMATELLTDPTTPFPPGWVKSHHLTQL